jgi:NAD(P)H dehydrogenase (quinone)
MKAGAKYLVRVSGGVAVAFPGTPSVVGQGHIAIEERLKSSGIGWVILKPGLFMQNTLGQAAAIKNDGKFFGTATPDAPLALIDVRDTGAVGARILIDPAPHAGKTYEFTGKATTFSQLADALSQTLGKKVSYVPLSLEQNETAVRGRGLPDWLTTHMLLVAKGTAAGGFSKENTKPIEDIAKRPPITFKKFVEDFKGAFA